MLCWKNCVGEKTETSWSHAKAKVEGSRAWKRKRITIEDKNERVAAEQSSRNSGPRWEANK